MTEETTQESPGTRRIRELHQTQRKSDKSDSSLTEWKAARQASEEVAAELDALYDARAQLPEAEAMADAMEAEGMKLSAAAFRRLIRSIRQKEET
jgi:hypothetical protein